MIVYLQHKNKNIRLYRLDWDTHHITNYETEKTSLAYGGPQ